MLFAFVSCEKDEPKFTEAPQNDGIIVKTIYEDEIWANEKLASTLREFLNNGAGFAGKNIHSDEYGYTIHTDKAIYIETPDGYHSYTFYISFDNSSDNYLNNIMLSLNAEGGYDVFGVEYELTLGDFMDIDQNELANSGIFLIPLDLNYNDILDDAAGKMPSALLNCDISITWDYVVCDEAQVDGVSDWCWEVDIDFVDCEIINGYSTVGTGSFNNMADWGDGPPHGSGGTAANGSHTSPTMPPHYYTTQALYEQLKPHIQSAQALGVKYWLHDNYVAALKIDDFLNTLMLGVSQQEKLDFVVEGLDFLVEESFSQEAVDFFLLALDEFEDGVEVDFEERVIRDKSFLNNQKANCVYENLQGLSSTVFNDIIGDHFGSSKNAHIQFEIRNISTGDEGLTCPYTSSTGKSYYKIVLDPDFVQNASTMEIALAIVHEAIHAELLERCIISGLIQQATTINDQVYITFNANPGTTYTMEDQIFNALVNYYNSLGNGNPQWNHDLFTVLSYRTALTQNLLAIHPWLDDQTNPFQNTINSDGTFVDLADFFDNLTWIGLGGTQAYTNLSPAEKTKIAYALQLLKGNYNQTCN